MNKIDKLKNFLQENYPNIQAFNTRSFTGDYTTTVYNEDGITVDYAPGYQYIEIFGLTDKEFEDLLDKNSFLGSLLKTFEIKEVKDENN